MDKTYTHMLNQIPNSVDFDFISVKTNSTKKIYLDNIADVSIIFQIENAEGFIFEPNKGVVPKNSKLEINVKINPNLAEVLVGNAKITLDNKVSKIIKMSCIGKYARLQLNKFDFDFGIVQIGNSVELDVIVINDENVSANFIIEKTSVQPGKNPECFFLSDKKGEVPPKSNFLIKIKYKPIFPNIISNETYALKVQGGNIVNFTCSGQCVPLKTWIGNKYINFKSIELGSQTTRLIRVHNDSNVQTEFQIYHDNSGPFKFDVLDGIIPAKSNVRVNITFKPYECMLYYQRIFVLIKNHNLLTLDIYGACHDLLNKFPILEQKQIDLFRYKLSKGFYLPNNKGHSSENSKLSKSVAFKDSNGSGGEDVLIDFTNPTQLHKEMFWPLKSKSRLISFDIDYIDFNYIEAGTCSEGIPFHVYNNSNEKIKIKWIYEKPIIVSNLVKGFNIFNIPSTVFIIQPEEGIITPNGQAEFKAYFKPNKPEYYFFSDMPCIGTILTSYNKNQNLMKTTNRLANINKKKLSEFGKDMISKSIENALTGRNTLNNFKNTKNQNFTYFDPPIPTTLSLVGHSFPPETQIYMPMYDLIPKKEIFFPPATINQSLFQVLKIQNKSDTPLHYKITPDQNEIFRIYKQIGCIPANEFNLICIEFCPKDCTVYRWPLRIIFNHDSSNIKTILVNGLCTDPVIELEGIKNEIYFPPSYIGMKAKKTITLKNLSPIKISVEIEVNPITNGAIDVNPSYFEMETNQIKNFDIYLTPSENKEITTKLKITAERLYDPQNENFGIFNPKISEKDNKQFDRRPFIREILILGKGSDGDLTIKPEEINFGTVKAGFHKKLSFSIFNPSITNFYIKIIPKYENNNINNNSFSAKDDVTFDFMEGMVNSFCKKEVNVTFSPRTRASIDFNVHIYTTSNKNKEEQKNDIPSLEEKKCTLRICGQGDYPLIKIVDLRNSIISSSTLWRDFNVDEANEELQKELTQEEIYFAQSVGSKIENTMKKLKLIRFDFGKHILNKKEGNKYMDVFLTLKNEGGVLSEFSFKFPDDAAIKREIWMDPVEPTSNDKIEYHVMKERIFSIEPRKSKLEPNETCNIKLRYNIKEKGQHKLRIIFQIINGKPIIFELFAETLSDKVGILNIPKEVLDFKYIPIGYMNYICAPIALVNISGAKIKYYINTDEVNHFNKKNDNFEIFTIDNNIGSIGPGDTKYIIAHFRPLTNKFYQMELTLNYTDEINLYTKKITIQGTGYHPLKYQPTEEISPFENMPKNFVCNYYNGDMIQKCGFNVEELDFGKLFLNKPKNKTFILYNYSTTNSFSFDFIEPGFLIEDQLIIQPNKGTIEPGDHKLIKAILTPKYLLSQYEGDIQVKIHWNTNEQNNNIRSLASMKQQNILSQNLNQNVNINSSVPLNSTITKMQKENLYLRIIKKIHVKDSHKATHITESDNECFIETILQETAKEILSTPEFEKEFLEKIDTQPLSLYEWTDDSEVSTQKDARNRYLTHVNKDANNTLDVNFIPVPKRNYSPTRVTHRHSGNNIAKIEGDEFSDDEDYRIQDKYMEEIVNKFKLSIPEINEKLTVVNEDSRKIISDVIMENTVYNIISEAVYGETDLTEKPRIYFFSDKKP